MGCGAYARAGEIEGRLQGELCGRSGAMWKEWCYVEGVVLCGRSLEGVAGSGAMWTELLCAPVPQ